MHKSFRKIKQDNKKYDCVKQFVLLFFHQKFNEIITLVENTELNNKQKKVIIVYKRIAFNLFTTVTTLKDERKCN